MKIELTPADKKLVATASAEVARLDSKLTEILTLKCLFQEATASYARGDLDLISAASLVTARGADRDAIQSTLRQAVKLARTEALQSLADIVAARRQDIVSELDKRCKELESAERQASIEAGIAPDGFMPSHALVTTRLQHGYARRDLVGPVIPSELAELAAT